MADEITFDADPTKSLLRLLGCIAFVIVGYLIREGTLFGWASMIFFGLLIPISLITMLLPNSMYLRLDPEGFEVVSFFRKKRTKWTDVQSFELNRVGGLIIGGAKVIRIVNAAHYHGMEGTIANRYNTSLTDIMHILNEWRKRYGSKDAGRATLSGSIS